MRAIHFSCTSVVIWFGANGEMGMTETEQNRWQVAIEDLLRLYREIDQNSRDLAFLSLVPILLQFWNVLKFYFLFLFGMFLFVPVNLVILIRNVFPGHWSYQPFFFKQVAYILLWIWRGEAPSAPVIQIRPLTNRFVWAHLRKRVLLVRSALENATDVPDELRVRLLAQMEEALVEWRNPIGYFLSLLIYALIVGGIAYLAYSATFDSEDIFQVSESKQVAPEFAIYTVRWIWGVLILSYILWAPLSAFSIKRGLMIGRKGWRAYFPGGVQGKGFYDVERRILDGIGITAREQRIDLKILAIAYGISLISTFFAWTLVVYELPDTDPEVLTDLVRTQQLSIVVYAGIMTFLFVFAIWRRNASCRR